MATEINSNSCLLVSGRMCTMQKAINPFIVLMKKHKELIARFAKRNNNKTVHVCILA